MAGFRDRAERLKIESFLLAPDPVKSQCRSYSSGGRVPNFYFTLHVFFRFCSYKAWKAKMNISGVWVEKSPLKTSFRLTNRHSQNSVMFSTAWVFECLPLEWLFLCHLLLNIESTLWLLFIIYQWVIKMKDLGHYMLTYFWRWLEKKTNTLVAEMKYLVIPEYWCGQSVLFSRF